MSQLVDEKYEKIFNGFKNESVYKKCLIKNINETKYEDLKEQVCGKINYRASFYDVIRIAEAYKSANEELKRKLEYILTDINYHYECGELQDGNADKIIEETKKEIIEALKKEALNIFENTLNQNHDRFEISSKDISLKEYSILELEYLESIGILKQTNKATHTFKLSQECLDSYLERKWEELEDVPFIEVNKEQVLDDEYWDFTKGITTNLDIWRYFDENHSKGTVYLLYEYSNDISSDKNTEEEEEI